MTPAPAPKELWICAYVIDFSDGAESEYQVLHQGTKKECENVSRLIPAIAYSGSRPVVGARMVIARCPERVSAGGEDGEASE